MDKPKYTVVAKDGTLYDFWALSTRPAGVCLAIKRDLLERVNTEEK